MQPSQGQASALASVRAIIAGTQKHTPDGSLTFGNGTYAAQAKAKARDEILALRDVTAKVGPVLHRLKPAKAKAPLSSEQKAAAAAKVRATRAARGTTSKKQKAAIEGTVTAPATPPAAPTAPAKPAT